MDKNMTALISLFARAYHSKNCKEKIYDDSLSAKILSDSEYRNIASNMVDGIKFFYPSFCGTDDEALSKAVNGMLAPTPLGRAAFANDALKTAVATGTRQYIICAAGYDTFAYRLPDWAKQIKIFEIDKKPMIKDKLSRLKKAEIPLPKNAEYICVDFSEQSAADALLKSENYNKNEKSFFSLLGLVYYITQNDFEKLLKDISSISSQGSTVVFDYQEDAAGEVMKKQAAMASAANEKMSPGYSYSKIEKILSDNGFLIYEHLNSREITERFFSSYNKKNPNESIYAPEGVNYCLAVKQNF